MSECFIGGVGEKKFAKGSFNQSGVSEITVSGLGFTPTWVMIYSPANYHSGLISLSYDNKNSTFPFIGFYHTDSIYATTTNSNNLVPNADGFTVKPFGGIVFDTATRYYFAGRED